MNDVPSAEVDRIVLANVFAMPGRWEIIGGVMTLVWGTGVVLHQEPVLRASGMFVVVTSAFVTGGMFVLRILLNSFQDLDALTNTGDAE